MDQVLHYWVAELINQLPVFKGHRSTRVKSMLNLLLIITKAIKRIINDAQEIAR